MVQFYILCTLSFSWSQYIFSNQKSQINDKHLEESCWRQSGKEIDEKIILSMGAGLIDDFIRSILSVLFCLSEACISPCFRFPPPISVKIFRLRGKFSQFHLFPQNFPIFIHQNFLPFLSSTRRLPILNFPLFPLFQDIPPISQKFYYFPLLFQIPPDFVKFTYFLHTLCVFVSPLLWPWCIYASHNARPWTYWTLLCERRQKQRKTKDEMDGQCYRRLGRERHSINYLQHMEIQE